MASITKKMSPSEMDALYQKLKPLAKREFQPAYTRWAIQTGEMTVTAYNSGKVLFQGKDLDWLMPDEPEQKPSSVKKQSASSSLANTFPQAGSDEVGTGDFFGPVVVAAVLVKNQETADQLKALGITDSKALNDAKIMQCGPLLEKTVPYSIQILNNEKYNEIWSPVMNLNRIKARMHLQAYRNLEAKGNVLPQLKIIDQFCVPASFYKHTAGMDGQIRDFHFETKAESRYISVAAASVLARYAFLNYWTAMEKKYDAHFAKGGGAQADVSGREFMKDHTLEDLRKVAKLNFQNVNRITKK